MKNEDSNLVSTLGINWLPDEDVYSFKIQENECKLPQKVTKRSVASDAAKLFDPIGWISPVIIRAKILLQNLWLLRLDWDDEIPEELAASWLEFKAELSALTTLKIPRWLGTQKHTEWELHCFCDASERTFATALYAVF